jgi:hypothetical protein
MLPDGVELKLIVPPTHAGPSLFAVIPSVLTNTLVVALAVQPEAEVLAVTV